MYIVVHHSFDSIWLICALEQEEENIKIDNVEKFQSFIFGFGNHFNFIVLSNVQYFCL